MIPESPLDDPGNAGFAWARYRRPMRWTGHDDAMIDPLEDEGSK
jgi:hypothetical protein